MGGVFEFARQAPLALAKCPFGTGAPSSLQGQGLGATLPALREPWVTFFQKPHIWMMLGVVFFYRFGEGFIEKFGPPWWPSRSSASAWSRWVR